MPAVIDWMEGWERREGEDGTTEGVQRRKRERRCGRQEGNVTRQGGDIEHRITVCWVEECASLRDRVGGRCVHM